MIKGLTHNALFPLFLCLVIVCSCSKKEGSGIVSRDGFATIPVDINASKQAITDLVESVEIIQLEETPSSLLGDVYEYEKLGSSLVLRNFNTNSIIKFTGEGKYVSSFSKSGNGPKEYSFILSFWVDGESIFIYDSPNGRVQEYDIQGNYKSSTRISQSAINSIRSKAGKFYLSTIRPIEGMHKFYVIILDAEGKPIDMQIPYKYGKYIIRGGYSDLRLVGDDMIHHYTDNDTVYIQREGKFEPYLSFDFGDKWAWKGVGEITSMNEFEEVVRQKDKVSAIAPSISEEQVYLTYFLDGTSTSVLIDLNSGKTASIRNGYSREFRPLQYENESLVFNVNSTALADFVNLLGTTQVRYLGKASLESIESSENPVLVKVKFKSSEKW